MLVDKVTLDTIDKFCIRETLNLSTNADSITIAVMRKKNLTVLMVLFWFFHTLLKQIYVIASCVRILLNVKVTFIWEYMCNFGCYNMWLVVPCIDLKCQYLFNLTRQLTLGFKILNGIQCWPVKWQHIYFLFLSIFLLLIKTSL